MDAFEYMAISLVLALIPSVEVKQPWMYETKLVGGTLLFLIVGLWLYRRGSLERDGRPAATSGQQGEQYR